MTINIRTKDIIKVFEFILLIAIFGLLLWSQPWNTSDSSQQRKITVTGDATIEAEPDEFSFNPYFELEGSDQDVLKTELSKLTSEVVERLKELGVEEKDLKLDASSYDRWYWREGEDGVLNAYLQIKVRNKDLVQKVQDYLLTTPAKGQLTSQATFSEDRQKELDNQAVEQAIDDAKAKAELQAKKFDAKIGKLLEVNQQQDSIFPSYLRGAELDTAASVEESASLPVLSGENEYRQSVTVTYELQ